MKNQGVAPVAGVRFPCLVQVKAKDISHLNDWWYVRTEEAKLKCTEDVNQADLITHVDQFIKVYDHFQELGYHVVTQRFWRDHKDK